MDKKTQVVKTVGELKSEFFDNFFKKQMSFVLKNTVKNSFPVNSEGDEKFINKDDIDSKIYQMSNKVIDTMLDSKNLTYNAGNTYFDKLAEDLKDYIKEEADYRFDEVMEKIDNGIIDITKPDVYQKIADEFHVLVYTKPGLTERVMECMKSFEDEQSEVVDTIKEKVIKDITETTNKNNIISTAVKEIHDAKKKEEEEINNAAQNNEQHEDSTDSEDKNTEDVSKEPSEKDQDSDGESVDDSDETVDNSDSSTPTEDDEKESKESILFDSPERVCEAFIPTSPDKLLQMKPMEKNRFIEKFIKFNGSIEAIARANIDSLRIGISTMDKKTSNESLKKRFNELEEVTKEAIALSNRYNFSMQKLGFTPRGVFRKDDYTAVEAGKMILKKFFNKNYKPQIKFTKVNTTTEALDLAFDLIFLKQMRKKNSNSVSKELIQSVESILYKSISDFEKDAQDKIRSVIDLGDIELKNVISYDEFFNSIKDSIVERDIKKSPKEQKEELLKTIIDKYESTFNVKINDEEIEIIKTLIDGDDPVEYLSNYYEKFVISLAKRSVENNNSIDGKNVERLARMYTTFVRTLETLQLLPEKEVKNLKSLLQINMA